MRACPVGSVRWKESLKLTECGRKTVMWAWSGWSVVDIDFPRVDEVKY